MSDTAYFILVLTGAAIVIFGAAYWMDKNRRKASTKVPIKLGPVSQVLLWLSRGILVITILALAGSFLLDDIVYARLAWNFLLAYIIAGLLFQITRRRGI